MDFQKKYLDLILGLIAISKIESIIIEPTLMDGLEIAFQKREAAIRQAKDIAIDFWKTPSALRRTICIAVNMAKRFIVRPQRSTIRLRQPISGPLIPPHYPLDD